MGLDFTSAGAGAGGAVVACGRSTKAMPATSATPAAMAKSRFLLGGVGSFGMRTTRGCTGGFSTSTVEVVPVREESIGRLAASTKSFRRCAEAGLWTKR